KTGGLSGSTPEIVMALLDSGIATDNACENWQYPVIFIFRADFPSKINKKQSKQAFLFIIM
ncbi:MAG: hypothetical protein II789_09240, partial [Clostridia bacterium]|nr:hypothetical protein [Clostridia bacterium]